MIDVVALGELLIDFASRSADANGYPTMQALPGGAPANFLAALTKYGKSTAFLGKVGDDTFGHLLVGTVKEAGIETRGIVIDPAVFTTLAFVTFDDAGDRSFSFARKPGADTQLSKDDVNYDIIKDSKIFHTGSLSMTDEPACTATFEALEFAKKNDIIVSYDPNYRKMLWKDEETAIKGMRSILSYVDIIKISDEEIHLLTDTNNPQDAAKELMDKGIDCVIVTLGSKGAYIATRDADVLSPCPEGKVVDTTGAGDSFMGAFLYRMSQDNKKPCELTKEDITDYAEFANKVATIVVGRRGALNSMPSIEEVKNFK